jgi:hypothetical protein
VLIAVAARDFSRDSECAVLSKLVNRRVWPLVDRLCKESCEVFSVENG